MKDNGPVTQKEVRFEGCGELVSVTDMKGRITYVNDAFVDISGYSLNELIGSDHSMVRHRDMPPAAFNDMWKTIKAGKNWRGVVKNRCKNGDHYWVNAFVCPVVKNDQVVGFQSVRSEPTREEIEKAEALYARMRKDGSIAMPRPSWLQRLQIRHFVRSMSAVSAVLSLAVAYQAFIHGLMFAFYAAIGTIVSVVLLAWVVRHRVLFTVEKTTRAMRLLASGDLDNATEPVRYDEMGELADNFRMVKARFGVIIGQVMENTSRLVQYADGLSERGYTMQNQMHAQVQHTTQVASAMSQMSSTVEEVAQNMTRTAETIEQTQDSTCRGDELVSAASASMEQYMADLEQTIAQIQASAAESEKISTVTETISDIAEQTNLLALNAAIEAARAGDQGRGFAVVADEVRGLAQRTQKATGDIRQMLEGLRVGIGQASENIVSNNQVAKETLTHIQGSKQILRDIVDQISLVRDMGVQVATAADEQATVTKEMSRSVEQIHEQSSAASQQASETGEVARQLTEHSQILKVALADFKLNGASDKAHDFSAIKNAHLAWKSKMRAFLNGNVEAMDRKVACSHHHCGLGKWFYGEGKDIAGHLPAYRQLEKPHAQLHRTLKDIIDLHDKGNFEAANNKYLEIEPLSQQVVAGIEALEQQLMPR
ncbi:methyl-accepting chemotaxis protein [Salinivibrio sp. SS2]|uniref:methyl-accepting chemotaxis protein n=1 Tax=Salinivibrio sp. SS2 TaxID=1892894 RepID=UPI00084C7EA8|nr:methyl-accepting chemotaxis protein [Salinivibrio sp. DV]ODQ01263.1 hypothetical protein BGK46_03125 [Salinivibrio sp. DV]